MPLKQSGCLPLNNKFPLMTASQKASPSVADYFPSIVDAFAAN